MAIDLARWQRACSGRAPHWRIGPRGAEMLRHRVPINTCRVGSLDRRDERQPRGPCRLHPAGATVREPRPLGLDLAAESVATRFAVKVPLKASGATGTLPPISREAAPLEGERRRSASSSFTQPLRSSSRRARPRRSAYPCGVRGATREECRPGTGRSCQRRAGFHRGRCALHSRAPSPASEMPAEGAWPPVAGQTPASVGSREQLNRSRQ